MQKIKKLPTPGVVIGVIALVFAVAGSANALKGQNSVGKDDIKKGSVNAQDIAKDAVGQSEIAAGAESALKDRWALVNELGQVEQQSGGFTLVNCYQANANCYLKVTGEDLRDDGLQATIAVANTDGSAVFSGEAGVAPCGLPSVACAPPGTESNDVVVVTPRESDGTPFGAGTGAPAPGDAARFYVSITTK